MNHTQILVTGSTGNVGSQALRALLPNPHVRVRALVRTPSQAGWIADAGGELASGDLGDRASVARAMASVDTLLLITPAGLQASDQAATAIAVAKEAGVRKVVRLSAIKAAEDGPTDNTRQHARTERLIRDSGMRFVFLRPNYYMQNLMGSLGSIVGEGTLYAGMGDARIALVDARDVGDSMAAAALTDRFDGWELELSGPASIGHADIAVEIGKAIGRDVRYVPVSPEVAGQAVRAFGMDEWTEQVIVDYSRAYSGGFGDFVMNSVKALLERTPTDIATFARDVMAPAVSAMAAVRKAA